MPDQTLLEHAYIKLAGSLNDELQADLLELVVETSLQLPDMAVLTLHDTRLKWADAKQLDPGTEIEISTKAQTTENLLFKGEIVSLEPVFSAASQRLVVRAFDKTHRLTRIRKSATYVDSKDSDIVQKVAGEGGVTAKIATTKTVHKHVFQDAKSHWEFVCDRMAPLGLLVFGHLGELNCRLPSDKGPDISAKWGETLLDFQITLDTTTQATEFRAQGWDPKEKQSVVSVKQNGDGKPEVGESKDGKAMAGIFASSSPKFVMHRAIHDMSYADEISKGAADRVTTQFIEAEGKVHGNPKLLAGSTLKLENIGERFSGKYLVTTARHVFDTAKQGYTTEFHISGHHVPSVRTALLGSDAETRVADRLVVAVVTNNQDPEEMGRVKVKYPWLDDKAESYWARVIAPGAGKERGVYFLPEVDDEVLVGFELGDMNHPYILGGLWNGKDKTPESTSDTLSGSAVKRRIIKSRDGHFIVLIDDDGGGGITLQDKKGNVIKVESQDNKMTVDMKGDIEVKSQGSINITATSDIKLHASGNVEITADQELSMKASMGATLDGGMKTDVKGGMVNLN